MPKGVYYCTISTLAAVFYLAGSSSVTHPVDIIAKSAGSSCAVKQTRKTSATTRQRKVRNVRETFFSDMDLHNKEAVDLLNQLWHSGGGWKHVTTKDGRICTFAIDKAPETSQHVSSFVELIATLYTLIKFLLKEHLLKEEIFQLGLSWTQQMLRKEANMHV